MVIWSHLITDVTPSWQSLCGNICLVCSPYYLAAPGTGKLLPALVIRIYLGLTRLHCYRQSPAIL